MYRFSWPQTLAAFSVIMLLLVTVFIAVVLPNPTGFQITIFRLVSALCSAAIVGVVPGMLELRFESSFYMIARASVSFAAFVLVYFFFPSFFFR